MRERTIYILATIGILCGCLGIILSIVSFSSRQKRTEKITTVVTTTEKTTTETKEKIENLYYGETKVVDYAFVKENDAITWNLKLADDRVISGTGIEVAEYNYAYQRDGIPHLQLTFDAYKYVLSII